MNSGVRVPYHFEVAETQRITQKHEEFFQLEADKQYQLLDEGKITQPEFDKIIKQLDERKNSLLASLSAPTTSTSTTATIGAAADQEKPLLNSARTTTKTKGEPETPTKNIKRLFHKKRQEQQPMTTTSALLQQ